MGPEPETMPAYTPDWGEASGSELILDAAGRHFVPLEQGGAETGDLLARFDEHDRAIECTAVSPDGTRFLTASADRTVRIWDTATWTVQRVIDVWATVDPGGLRWPAL